MISLDIETSPDKVADELRARLDQAGVQSPTWFVFYGDVSAPLFAFARVVAGEFPDAPSIGCTSFQGVITARGFRRGLGVLVGEPDDGVTMAPRVVPCTQGTASAAAARAMESIREQMAGEPDMLLMHPTPGFEEEVLDGVRSVFGTRVPVFGGSAADDDISGGWQVFGNGVVERSGVVFAGLSAGGKISGAFVGGYLPSDHTAVVTKAEGRIVYELDGEPAASVYNRWTEGAIATQLHDGGPILSETNLLPLARDVHQEGTMPRRLLSHPEQVFSENRAMRFFSSLATGDTVRLMTNTHAGLIPRMRRATERAVERGGAVRGGLLVYCAGCLSSTLDKASEVGEQFSSVAGDVPFIGVSTFGEQGSFFSRGENYHGNLMCSAVVFR